MISSFYEQYQIMKTKYADSVVFRWVDTDGKSVCSRTYSQYCADIRRYVAYLKDKLGELDGKHIAILSQNRYDYFVAIYAGLLMNCVLVPLNYQKDLSEILDEAERADVSAAIVAPDALEWLPGLAEKYTGELIDMFGYREYPDSEIENVSELEALALIIYTSGTTGLSKGVMLSQKNLLYTYSADSFNSDYMSYLNSKAGTASYFHVLPMFHVSGLRAFDFLFVEGTIIICETPKYLYRDLSLMPCSCAAFVPVFFSSLLNDIKNGHRNRLGSISLFYTGGANVDAEAISALLDCGYFVENRYGLTESTGFGIINTSQNKKYAASIGRKEAIAQVRLDDGELCLRGDTIFMGYYKDPESTAEVFDEDDWFHTGDLARVDEEGYYYITGRKKNLIILSGGENVSPEELEKRLLADSDITEVVVKEKDGHIAAEIFCEAEKQAEIKAFVAELNKTLPTYKFIAEVEFRDKPFERTSTGKIKR